MEKAQPGGGRYADVSFEYAAVDGRNSLGFDIIMDVMSDFFNALNRSSGLSWINLSTTPGLPNQPLCV